MKKIGFQIVSCFMAILLLVSTMSFTVDKHFCCDHLVSLAVFGEADSCGMEMTMAKTDNDTSVNKACCSDETSLVQGQNTLDKTITLDLDQYVFLMAFVHSYVNLFEGLPQHFIPFKEYSPPLLVCDIQVLHDTFLI